MVARLNNAEIPFETTKNRWHSYVSSPHMISFVVSDVFKVPLYVKSYDHPIFKRLPLIEVQLLDITSHHTQFQPKPVGDNAAMERFQNASSAGLWMPRIEGDSIIRLKCHLPSSGKEIAILGVKFQELSSMTTTKGKNLCKFPVILIPPA